MAGPERHDPLRRRRRRFSPWTLLAPLALVIGAFFLFQAVFDSDLFTGASGDDDEQEEQEELDPELAAAKWTKVQEGQSLSEIAETFQYTIDELTACNPQLDTRTLQPGQNVRVERARCEDADKAAAGADPDPLAGETTVGAGASDAAATDG